VRSTAAAYSRHTPTCDSSGTLAHETTHWTAHESRLARDFGTKRFGSEGYPIEELVAELGAAFLCADLDLALETREDHSA
jgi:antirestriction protein ArdC